MTAISFHEAIKALILIMIIIHVNALLVKHDLAIITFNGYGGKAWRSFCIAKAFEVILVHGRGHLPF